MLLNSVLFQLSSIPGLENVTVSNTATNVTPVGNNNAQQQPGVPSNQHPDPSAHVRFKEEKNISNDLETSMLSSRLQKTRKII